MNKDACPRAEIWNKDCITGLVEHVKKDSVHLSCTSIPFEELFQYSSSIHDVGNNGSTTDVLRGRFALNMRFVIEQLFRVMAPGCNVCIHCQTLLAFKVQHGFIGRRDFRGALIEMFGAGGFDWFGEFVITKDPQRAANSQNYHFLQFATGISRNSCDLAPYICDTVLIFKKPGEHPCPVKALRHSRKNPGGWLTTDEWIRDAHGTWTDILEIDVIDRPKVTKALKEDNKERHVCCLQLEVIRRLVALYSNPVRIQPDVLVLDPFSGVGSTGYVCLGGRSPVTKLSLAEPRNYVGFELKESYYRKSLEYIEKAKRQVAERQGKDKTLLDLATPEESPAPDESPEPDPCEHGITGYCRKCYATVNEE